LGLIEGFEERVLNLKIVSGSTKGCAKRTILKKTVRADEGLYGFFVFRRG
jgi:hypothetical protein